MQALHDISTECCASYGRQNPTRHQKLSNFIFSLIRPVWAFTRLWHDFFFKRKKKYFQSEFREGMSQAINLGRFWVRGSICFGPVRRVGSAGVRCCSCLCWHVLVGSQRGTLSPSPSAAGQRGSEEPLNHPEAPLTSSNSFLLMLPIPNPPWAVVVSLRKEKRYFLWDRQIELLFYGFIVVSCARRAGEIPSSYLVAIFSL